MGWENKYVSAAIMIYFSYIIPKYYLFNNILKGRCDSMQNMIQILDLFEFKRPITEDIAPGINPNAYCITNFGRVWSNLTNSFRSIGHYKNGYCKLNIRLKDGSDKTLSIHRLVAMAFNPVPNMDILEVNHIDGNKDNNHISNLEWVTHYDNMKHARDTGLLDVDGENAYNATFTNDEVKIICKMLSDNIHYEYILQALGRPITKNNIGILIHIRLRHSWTHISKDYDFSGYTARKPPRRKN